MEFGGVNAALSDERGNGRGAAYARFSCQKLACETETALSRAAEQEHFCSLPPFCCCWCFELVHAHSLWEGVKEGNLRAQESQGFNTGKKQSI